MMNCKEFNENLAELFDSQGNQKLMQKMLAHAEVCKSCNELFAQSKIVFKNLKPSVSFISPDSGLKNKILNQIKKEEIKMETNSTSRFRIKKWQKGAIAVAASIAILVAIFMFPSRAPLVNTAQAAENIFLKSITAMESLKSIFISMNVRSLENEPFDYIGTDYDFIEYKYWKQFSGNNPWRVEKQGRIVVFDGEKQFLYLPESSIAYTASPEAGFVEWMKIFLDPKSIMENELQFAEKYDAVYKTEKTDSEIILTIDAYALGDFHNNYLKNSSVLESDNTRVYVFDKKTYLLKTFELFINKNGQSIKAIEIHNIAYNIPIEATTFEINLPKDVQWQELKEPGFNKTFTKISSKLAAKKFFTALADEDYDSITPIWSVLETPNEEMVQEIKNHFGGLEVIFIGEPFKSGLYPGEFVPYKIKLKNGDIKEFNLALRNDNPDGTWIVDGGI